MAGDSPSPPGAGWTELDGRAGPKVDVPTQAAELKVAVGLATAGGRVPQGDAHHFITVCGIAWCVAAAIAGVVLSLQIAGRSLGLRGGSGLTVPILSELGLGLVGATLVAICDRRHARHAVADAARGEAGRPVTHPAAVSAAAAERHEGGGLEEAATQLPPRLAAGQPDSRGNRNG